MRGTRRAVAALAMASAAAVLLVALAGPAIAAPSNPQAVLKAAGKALPQAPAVVSKPPIARAPEPRPQPEPAPADAAAPADASDEPTASTGIDRVAQTLQRAAPAATSKASPLGSTLDRAAALVEPGVEAVTAPIADSLAPVTQTARQAVGPVLQAVNPVLDSALQSIDPVLQAVGPLLSGSSQAPTEPLADTLLAPRSAPSLTLAPPATATPVASEGVPPTPARDLVADLASSEHDAPAGASLADAGQAPTIVGGAPTLAGQPSSTAHPSLAASTGSAPSHSIPATAGSAGAGGFSPPPALGLMLLLALVAAGLLHAFKEVPAFLRPAPFTALLERPG
jgi:hypothetical protein